MVQVELTGVGKSFGSVKVIHGVDLQVGQGEFVVFVGPSGCGKSTLLRMICGLEHLNHGEIRIDGRSMRGVDPAKREVAMVFQSYALYPHMTVEDNMGFALRMSGMGKRERAERVREAARILRLEDLLDRLPKQLSGGQRQRVAIGRAIVRNPKVFLFDEPLSNLDAELRVQMRIEIAALHKELGSTMIYVTHDQVEAMTLADRIVVLRGGRIEQIGTPGELYARPDNLFVAGFIGSPRMNLLSCKVLSVAGARADLSMDGLEERPFSMDVESGGLVAGETVTLGVRSEHVVLGAAGGIELEIDVAFVENLGGAAYLHAPGHPAGPIVFESRMETGTIGVGRHRVGIDPGRCHLFDRDGQAVAKDRRSGASAATGTA